MNTNPQNELSTLERITAPTPTYFRAVQVIAIIFGAIGAVIFQLLNVGITLPDWVALLGHKATLAVDITLIFFPQLTVDYKALEKRKELENIGR